MIKRLFWDVETSPNVVLSWRVGYKINIDQENILKERALICIGYKWEGDEHAQVLTWDKNQDDKAMLKKFVQIANQADEMVHHNGDSFDLPWLLTRCAFHRIPTFPAYKTADTLAWAKKRFLFNSNKLDYIARYLGIGGKIKTEFGLWKSIVLNRDAKALKMMADYCARDVELLEQVWDRMQMLVPHKTHVGVHAKLEKWTCPRCASESVKVNQTRVTAAGTVQKQMQCKKCGGNYTINRKSYEDYVAAKLKKSA